MLTLQTEIRVDGIKGKEIFDFLANPDDESYRAWWPGTHLQLHIRERGGNDHVGDIIYMDEYVGRRRLRMNAIVTEAVPGRKLVWRLKRGIKLPARPAAELVTEVMEELEDVAGWSLLLWIRLDRLREQVESIGLTYHSHEHGPDWDESACYEFTAAEVMARGLARWLNGS